MAADIPYLEVTGRKNVQNGGRSISKNGLSFVRFCQLSLLKIISAMSKSQIKIASDLPFSFKAEYNWIIILLFRLWISSWNGK